MIVLVMVMMIVIVTALLNGEMQVVVINMQFVVRSRLKLSLEDREVPGSSPRSLSRDR